MLIIGIVTTFYIIPAIVENSIIVGRGRNTLILPRRLVRPSTTTYSRAGGAAGCPMGVNRKRPHSREDAPYTEYLHLTPTS